MICNNGYAWNPSYRSFSIPFFSSRCPLCLPLFCRKLCLPASPPPCLSLCVSLCHTLPCLPGCRLPACAPIVPDFVSHCFSDFLPALFPGLSPNLFRLCLALCPPPWLPQCLLLYLPPFTPLSPAWHHLSFPLRLPFCLPLYSSLSQTVCPAASPTLIVTMSPR